MDRFDSNGQRLSVLFQGKNAYQTKLGGCISMLVYLIVLVYGSQKVIQLATYGDPDITTSQKFIPASENEHVKLVESGFNMLTLLWHVNPKNGKYEAINVPKSIGSFRMYAVFAETIIKPIVRRLKRIDCSKKIENPY